MSEMRLPEQAPLPPKPPAPPAPPSDQDQGSLIVGMLLAWAILIIGEAACLQAGLVAWVLPPAGILIAGIVMLNGSKPRTGKGLLLGLASILGVLLLLVAACFGLLSQSNFH